MTLKYLLNFIVIGDEWTAVPGASVEVACSVNILPNFAQYDYQPAWGWTFSTKVADFSHPEWLFQTRSVNAPINIGQPHDRDIPV